MTTVATSALRAPETTRPVHQGPTPTLPQGVQDTVESNAVRTEPFIHFPRPAHLAPTDGKGLAVIVIDGLSYPRMRHIIQAGVMPNLQAYLEKNDFHPHPYFPGLPATTPACMTGFNWGHNPIPGYRWYSKAEDRQYSADALTDFEKGYEGPARDGGNPGLVAKGSIHSCLAQGGSSDAHWSVSRLSHAYGEGGMKAAVKLALKDVQLHAARHPANFLRAVGRFVSHTWRNYQDGRAGINHEIHDAGSRGKQLAKAASTAIETSFCTTAGADGVRDSMKDGSPVIFIDFPGYDAIAHIYGPASPQADDALRSIDDHLGPILKQAEHGERGYEMAFVSDHGQSDGVNFSKLYGTTLKDLVADHIQNPAERIESGAADSLQHLYFMSDRKHWTMDDVEGRYPGLIGKLTNHPGLELVATQNGGTTHIFGKGGYVVVRDGEAEFHGRNVLEGKSADPAIVAQQIHRVAQMPNAGDLIVFGRDLGDNRVVSFDDKNGCHGGLGGNQNQAMVMVGKDRDFDTSTVANTSDLYWKFRSMTPEDGR